MVFPDGVCGDELARQLQRHQAGLRVIFTSGYSLDVAGHDLALREGVNFLQKPFQPTMLARTVRDCLDSTE